MNFYYVSSLLPHPLQSLDHPLLGGRVLGVLLGPQLHFVLDTLLVELFVAALLRGIQSH